MSGGSSGRGRRASFHAGYPPASDGYASLSTNPLGGPPPRSATPGPTGRRRTTSLVGGQRGPGVLSATVPRQDGDGARQQPPYRDESRRLPPPTPSSGQHRPSSPSAYAMRPDTRAHPVPAMNRNATPRGPAVTMPPSSSAMPMPRSGAPNADYNASGQSQRPSSYAPPHQGPRNDSARPPALQGRPSAVQRGSSPPPIPSTSRAPFPQRVRHPDVGRQAPTDTRSAARTGREPLSDPNISAPRRPPASRQYFTPPQQEALENEFLARGGYLDRSAAEELSQRLGIRADAITRWFANRRAEMARHNRGG